MQASLNRFALLASGETERPNRELIDESLQLTGPVTYSFKTTQWNLSSTISHLRQFKLQNITADRQGTIFLRFAHEAQAKQVVHWLTNEVKINAKIARVSNSLADQQCYYCHRIGHWGSECEESQLSQFPSELIALISDQLEAPDLFDFMLSSKTIFNAIANRQKVVVVARPHWRAAQQMKLKLGLLKYFKSVEKLVLRSLYCLATTFPMDVIATQYTRLTSLTINNCVLRSADHKTNRYLDESWVKAMTRMTRLQKLDLDSQDISKESFERLQSATHLTQLRVSAESFGEMFVFESALLSNVKKLSLKRNLTTALHDNVLYADQFDHIKSLYLYNVLINASQILPSLERLIAPYESCVKAPNLTKLALYCTGDLEDGPQPLEFSGYPKLKTLLLDGFSFYTIESVDFVDFTGLYALKKLTLSGISNMDFDLSPLINLEILHLVDLTRTSIMNIPESLKVLRVASISFGHRDCGAANSELANLNITRFEWLSSEHGRRCGKTTLPKYLKQLAHCDTLREMKIEYTDKSILPHCAKFTQLTVLDLVQSFKNTYISSGVQSSTQEDIIELSKQLPNTRIYHGYNLPATLRRPKEWHWYDKRFEDPFDCSDCTYCQAWKREYLQKQEQEFDSNRSTACFDPKPFKEHWAWY